nr:cytochrome P450 [Agasicles hygrophila]
MILVCLSILIVFVLLYYHLVYSPLTLWRRAGVAQKSVLHNFINSWFLFVKGQSVVDLIKGFYDEFPGVRYSGTYQFNSPILVIRDPVLIKKIVIKDFEHFVDRRTYIPEDADPMFGKSLFSLRGDKWRNMRSTLSPAFTSSKMKSMFVLMKECSKNFVKFFSEKNQEITEVQFKDISTRFCADVIATVAYGISVNSLENPENEFYIRGKSSTNFGTFSKMIKFIGNLAAPKLYKLLDVKLADKDEREFFTNLIEETIRAREEGITRPDVIQLLVDTRKGLKIHEDHTTEDTGFATVQEDKRAKGIAIENLTNEDITAQAFIFFFAGFESVSTLVCIMAHELATNPDIQDKLRSEIIEVGGSDLTYDVLVGMKYMDMVVSETLRKWPAQAGFERICTKPYEIAPVHPNEKMVKLEKGAVVIFPTVGIHRDPEYFPDPDRFDPERFNDANKHNIVPCSYTPFGGGPRGCIASRMAILETKILFYYLLSSFELVPVEKTCIPLTMAKNALLISVEGGCWLGLKKISSS